MSYASDSQNLCEFLLSRAQTDPSTKLSKDFKQKLKELTESQKQLDQFLSLSETAIQNKLSWASFKKNSAEKGIHFSEYYQPQYDKRYMDKYCGKAQTEASFDSKNKDSHFEKMPIPTEHEYFNQGLKD